MYGYRDGLAAGVLLRLPGYDLHYHVREVDVLPVQHAAVAEPKPRVQPHHDERMPLAAHCGRDGEYAPDLPGSKLPAGVVVLGIPLDGKPGVRRNNAVALKRVEHPREELQLVVARPGCVRATVVVHVLVGDGDRYLRGLVHFGVVVAHPLRYVEPRAPLLELRLPVVAVCVRRPLVLVPDLRERNRG